MKLIKKPNIVNKMSRCDACGAEFEITLKDFRKVDFWYSGNYGYVRCKCCKTKDGVRVAKNAAY